MKWEKKVITRRDFLRAGSRIAAGGLMGIPLMGSAPVEKSHKSKVVLVRDRDVTGSSGNLRPDPLKRMLDHALEALFDMPDPGSLWKNLVSPVETVGIKSNVWHYLPTPEPLIGAIQSRLLKAGVKEQNIATDDRGVINNPVFKKATALINIRPMRTHHWSGLGTLLKNYIMFTSQPWRYHGNACENLGALWHFPQVKGKTRLNILVMLTPLFHGVGPHHFSRRYTWPYNGLVVSTDPVAADATGARIIQAKRNIFFGRERPISPTPRHIVVAGSKFGLGKSSPEEIDLIKLGWEEGALI
jgi:hypothetical protein